jgi:4-diphosphocytidyl-2-C-methyl-D-erythritol kinase
MKDQYVHHTETIRTPAKINLHLEILARRTDGYHDLETLMVPISIFDSLSFTATSDEKLTLRCGWEPGIEAHRIASQHWGVESPWEPLPAPEQNLAWRAIARLREEAQVETGGHLRITKRIPAAAGLGGASSNAAAALVLANRGWNLHWDTDRLAELASRLGSDVPFFLYGEAAICRGRGERIETLGTIPRLHVVVVRPLQGLSTADVFRRCRVPESPRSCQPMADALRRGDNVAVAAGLHNRLHAASAALSPSVARMVDALQQVGGVGYSMSGSGTSHFVMCRNHRHAQTVAGRMRSIGIGAVFQAQSV